MSLDVMRTGALAALVALAASAASLPAADVPILRLRAFAVEVGGAAGARTETVEIVIERWSTDAERKSIGDILRERPERLLETVRKIEPRVGFIRSATSVGWDIRYARRTEIESGGQRTLIATDRPMSFFERSQNTRSSEYEYIVGDIRLGPDGKGEGKLATAAKVRYYPDSREVERTTTSSRCV